MSDTEQEPKADNHQSDVTTAEEENIVSSDNLDSLIKVSVAKNCDDLETAEICDGLPKPALVEKSDLEEPADTTGDDEVEAGEIPSPKGSDEEKTFAVECELDFEDEAERESADKESVDKESADISSKTDENKEESVIGGDDDGECTDEVDEFEELEEGELKDELPGALEANASSKPNPPTKQVCRFYNRGQCFYGNNCRFLHVNFLKTGNYSMFAPARVGFPDGFDPPPPIGGMTHGMMNHRSGAPPPRTGPDFPPVPPLCPPAPAAQPPALESAWERGLREAKLLVKKANKRKIEEPDFEDKRLNLSLVVNEKNIPDIEKEIPYKKKRRENSSFLKREYDESHDIYNDDYESRPHSREGHFDNTRMEIRYQKELRRGRSRMGDRERDKFPKSPDQNKDRFRDDRLQVQSRSSRVDDYFDPWRRSKSPKGNVRRTRSRERSGSYSSVSSYSYSSRSSRSSGSYSRSSSSSRSPHPHQKRTPSPTIANPPFASPKIGPNKFTTMKNKPGGRPSSRTRSMSRTNSRSRSRSFSRSISMDSVSSASSSISRSSHSPSHQNSHASILRKHENSSTAAGEKSDSTNAANTSAIPLPTVYLNYNAPNKDIVKVEKTKETSKDQPSVIEDDERDPLEEKFLTPVGGDAPFPSLQHLLPTNDKVKETFKGTPHKQQIKLTLLNKTPKLNSLPKKELDVNRKQNDEPSKPASFHLGVKGPLSPPVPPVVAKPAPVLVPKKSASSRRDELLKQLKAVEDAIARKRAKFG